MRFAGVNGLPYTLAVVLLTGIAVEAHAEEVPEVGAPEAPEVIDGPDPHARARAEEYRREAPPVSPPFGYVPGEGFRLKSEDEAYMLRIALQVGLKFEPAWTDGDADFNSTLAFVRPILRGNLFKPWFGYRVSMELARETPRAFDVYVDLQPWDVFGFRFGQQGTPVSRHESFGFAQIFFPEYAAVANYFWSGRERGLTLYGTALGERLDYFAGIYSGSPLDEPTNAPKNFVVEGRLTVNPWGPVNGTELPFTEDGGRLPTRASLTLQGYFGRIQFVEDNFNPTNSILTPQITLATQEMGAASGDVWFQTGPLILFGEFYWRRIQPREDAAWFNSYGAWGQAVLSVYRDVLGVGGRMNWIDPNRDLNDDQVFEVEGQFAWFIHPTELALKLRYAWLHQKSPSAAELSDFVLPFPEGKTNVATLQLTLAF